MPSSPDSFQNSFDSHEPRPELDSPFLNEEYLAEEARTAPTWRTPVPGFQLESPFLQAFEEGWGAIDESEAEEFEEFLGELDEEEFEEEAIADYPTHQVEESEIEAFGGFLSELDEEEFEEEAIADYSTYEVEKLETGAFSESLNELNEEKTDREKEDEIHTNFTYNEELEFDNEEEFNQLFDEFNGEESEIPSPTSQEEKKCKLNWDRLLSSLPEDLRKNLNDEDWKNATVLAIHHGIRDLTTLTRIIFYAQYGQNRGYCKLKNNQTDAKYKQYWNQVKSATREIMARPSPPLAQKGGIVCRKVERKLADSKPDNPKIDITGRYENQFKSNGRTLTDWTVSINQAGRHIEGIITQVRYPDPRPKGWFSHQDDDPKGRDFKEIYGDLQSDGSFLFFDKRNPSGNWGYFRFESGRLYWELSTGIKSGLVKISTTPTLINTASFDKLVWLHEKFPLTQLQIKHLVLNLAGDKMASHLQNYFTTPAGIRYSEKKDLIDQVAKLDLYIANVFTLEFSGVHDTDLELGQFYAKTILTNNKWTFKQIIRSRLDWIQIMLDVNKGNGFNLPAIKKYLGLKASNNIADPQAPPHEYKVTLKLTGATIFVGGYFGKITVEKINGQKWKETYKVRFIGGGIDVSFRDEIEGIAKTYHEWLPPDIPGEIRLGELGISIGSSAAAGFIQIFGSGYLPPMDVGYTDLDLKLEKPKLILLKVGGKAIFGTIGDKKFPDFDATKSIAITDYAADYNLRDDAHFCLGSALLTEDARQALRIVCANELVAFSSPTSTLEVIGHTDLVDTADRNLTLSLFRSENTVQAIKDILGSSFKIPDTRIKSSGKGENEAFKNSGLPQKFKDIRLHEKPDPKYRRVDIFLNSRLVISLKAL